MSDDQRDGRIDDPAVPLSHRDAGYIDTDTDTNDEPHEQLVELSDEPFAEPLPPIDPVGVLGLVALILLLPVIALALGYWSAGRISRGNVRGESLARWTVILGWIELIAVVAFWAVYFAVLAPIVALPR